MYLAIQHSLGTSIFNLVKLWAHLCRLWLDTVRRNDLLGCAPCLSHCFCLAIVSNQHLLGTSVFSLVKLWAHLCRLSIDTVRRNDLLGCAQCLTRYSCQAAVTSLGVSASSTAVSSYLQTVAGHSPQKSSYGLYTMLKLRAHVKLTVSQWLYLSSRS